MVVTSQYNDAHPRKLPVYGVVAVPVTVAVGGGMVAVLVMMGVPVGAIVAVGTIVLVIIGVGVKVEVIVGMAVGAMVLMGGMVIVGVIVGTITAGNVIVAKSSILRVGVIVTLGVAVGRIQTCSSPTTSKLAGSVRAKMVIGSLTAVSISFCIAAISSSCT